MSKHDATSASDTSNPVLWTVILVAFVAAAAWWFAYMFQGGALHANQHPVEIVADEGGAVVPDHAALIERVKDPEKDFVTFGKKIWTGKGGCTACHGEDGNLGSSNARKLGAEQLLNGNDPYSMYLTLKNGYNGMPPQGTLDPEEKYAVIAYIRETFFQPHNSSEYVEITDEYLASGGPNGPFPAPGGAAGGDGPPGKDFVLEAPVGAAMARSAGSVDRGSIDAARDRLRHAASALDGDAAAALRAIAENERAGSFILALVEAASEGERSQVVELVTDPGRNQFQPALALLPEDQFDALTALIREGR